MKDIYVKPAPGRLVRHPETGETVPEGGMAVPRVPYWLRRIKDGDVVECTPPAQPRPKKEPLSPKE